LYAHVKDNVIDAVSGLPPQKVYEFGRWWDLRDLDPAKLANVGWYLVSQTARPADTTTHRWDAQFTFDGTKVSQTWVQVAKTAEDIAQDTYTANELELLSKAKAAYTGNNDFLVNQNVTDYLNASNTPTAAQTFAIVKLALSHLRALTRQVNALIRLAARDLGSTSGT